MSRLAATGRPSRADTEKPAGDRLRIGCGWRRGRAGGALFRLALKQADHFREWGLAELHARMGSSPTSSAMGLLLVMAACGLSALLAAWMVRRFSPFASGSGIPHVESVLVQELPMAPYRLIPVKFVGGILAIGSGMALGREGPSVQMGATVVHLVGRIFRRNVPDGLVLLAAGAGAGLATAFNAPIAGAIFVLEELVRRFDTRIAIATFGALAGAIAVARVFLGQQPDFAIELKPYPEIATVPLDLLLGVFAGLCAVAYNKAVLGALSTTDRMSRWPVELRALLIGAVVGLVAWFGPGLVGGGDAITHARLIRPTPFRGSSLFFSCDSPSVRCRTRHGRPAGSLRRFWFWERNWD